MCRAAPGSLISGVGSCIELIFIRHSLWTFGEGDRGGEHVLIVHYAVQRERIHVARIGPEGMRLAFLVDRQSAVVAVESCLVAVWGREPGRDHLEVEWRSQSSAAGQNVI